MQKSGVAAVVGLLLLAVVLIQFAETPLAAQDFPTPTLPAPYATLAPDLTVSALAANFPHVDCSTSALPLLRLISCKVLHTPCIWIDQWGGESGVWPVDVDMSPDGDGDQIAQIPASGTHDAYMGLIAGETDLILVARVPSPDEIAAAAAAGIMLEAQPVARDALVFLVNGENPRDHFTINEVRAIYGGQIKTWGELGVATALSDDPANPIQAYIRDPDSASQESMDALVVHGTPMIDAPDLMMQTSIGLISSVEWDRAGIGYSGYYYTTFITPGDDVKLAAIDGVAPNPATIADGSYPLVTNIYAVTRADVPANSSAARLRDWLLTGMGQTVVAESGYVPLTME
jgi:ABC-type phosphate transport system substrate-binding protein